MPYNVFIPPSLATVNWGDLTNLQGKFLRVKADCSGVEWKSKADTILMSSFYTDVNTVMAWDFGNLAKLTYDGSNYLTNILKITDIMTNWYLRSIIYILLQEGRPIDLTVLTMQP